MGFRSREYQALTGTGFRVLELIDFLSQQQRKRTGAQYCTPSQAWMAERLNVAQETISRTISKLERLGFLVVQPRRSRKGKWVTNMYRLAAWEFRPVARMVRQLFTRKPAAARPVLFQTNQVPPKVKQLGREEGQRLLRELRESLAAPVPA